MKRDYFGLATAAIFTKLTSRDQRRYQVPRPSFGTKMNPIRNRPKRIFNKALRSGETVPGESPDDFKIYTSYKTNLSGQSFGLLKVVRKTDNRLLFPFTGAPELGPFAVREDAVSAAQELGERIVSDDIANPEA